MTEKQMLSREERISELMKELEINQAELIELQSMWEVAAIGTFAQSLENRMNIVYDQYDLEIGFLVKSPNSIITRLINVLVVQGRSRTFNDRVLSRVRRWRRGLRRTDGRALTEEKAAAAMKIDPRVYDYIRNLFEFLDESSKHQVELDFFKWPIKTRVWVIKTICDEKTAFASKYMDGRGAEPSTIGKRAGSDGYLCFVSFLPHIRAFDSSGIVALTKSQLVKYLDSNKKASNQLPAKLKAVKDNDALDACCDVLSEYVESVREAKKVEEENLRLQREMEEEERKRLEEEEAEMTRRMEHQIQTRRQSALRGKKVQRRDPELNDEESSYEESPTSDSSNDSDYTIPTNGSSSTGKKRRGGRTSSFLKLRIHKSSGINSIGSGRLLHQRIPLNRPYSHLSNTLRTLYSPHSSAQYRMRHPMLARPRPVYESNNRALPPDYYQRSREAIEEASRVFRTNTVPSHAMPLALQPDALKRYDNKQYLNDRDIDSGDDGPDPTSRPARIVRNGDFRTVIRTSRLSRQYPVAMLPSSNLNTTQGHSCEMDGLYSSQLHAKFVQEKAERMSMSAEVEMNEKADRRKRKYSDQDNDCGIATDEALLETLSRCARKIDMENEEQDDGSGSEEQEADCEH
ncbi:hypothetical protein ACOME3_003539 [Neoechinorhynchus agilis]